MEIPNEEIFTDFLCFRLGAITRKINRYYNSRYAEYGITVGQSFVLFHLLDNEGSSVKDIASRIQLDSPAITGFIDRLVEQGLVERREDPQDRRSLQIYLTPKGRELAQKLLFIAQEYNRLIKASIPPDDLQAFTRSITTLERAL